MEGGNAAPEIVFNNLLMPVDEAKMTSFAEQVRAT
jgi:hypothetical protein